MMVTWVLAAGSYLVVPAATVLVATWGRPRLLLGRSSDQDAGDIALRTRSSRS
jgi:hypothetical protein